jgi:hypothetical protein
LALTAHKINIKNSCNPSMKIKNERKRQKHEKKESQNNEDKWVRKERRKIFGKFTRRRKEFYGVFI